MTKKPRTRSNPGRFSDALTEDRYGRPFARANRRKIRREFVNWLRKKHKPDRASLRLAKKLARCKASQRCRSLACPQCAYAVQNVVTAVATAFVKAQPDATRLVAVSVVPADGTTQPGNLSIDQHQRNIRRWKERLGKAGVTWFIGATDWSFNEHAQDRYVPHWSEHFYGITTTDDPEALKRSLQKQFSKTDAIPRPVKIKPWDRDEQALRYMLKTDFFRRIGTDNGQRAKKNSPEKRKCRATDKQPLRSREKRELLVHLDQIGIQGRLILKWLQIVHQGKGQWILADRRPQSVGT